jgi:hypothetical protein
LPCLALNCLALPCPASLPCLALPCLALPCPALPPCLALPPCHHPILFHLIPSYPIPSLSIPFRSVPFHSVPFYSVQFATIATFAAFTAFATPGSRHHASACGFWHDHTYTTCHISYLCACVSRVERVSKGHPPPRACRRRRAARDASAR